MGRPQHHASERPHTFTDRSHGVARFPVWGAALALACLWLIFAARPAAAQGSSIGPAAPCAETRNLTGIPGVNGINNQPVLSGDGARVAFWSTNDLVAGRNTDGSIEIFALETGSLAKTQLTVSNGSILGGFNLAPTISRTGTSIAFYSDRDVLGNGRNADANFEIFLALRASNGTWSVLQVTDTRGSANIFPSISADGKRIVFVSDDAVLTNEPDPDKRNFEVVLATIGAGNVPSFRQVTDTERTTNDQPRISDDGNRVVFTAGSTTSSQVYVWNVDGSAPPFALTTAGSNEQPTVNGDGTAIAYISTVDGRPRVVLHRLSASGAESSSSVIVPPASNTVYRSPSISDNGERVAYVVEQTVATERLVEVHLHDTTTGLGVPIAALGGGITEQPSISGDGTRVAFVGVQDVSNNPDDTGSEIYTTECPISDLGVSFVTPPPATVLAGVNLVYTLSVVNRGPSLARGARLVYNLGALPPLPQNVTYSPALSDARCSQSGSVVTCALGDMALNASTTVRIGWNVPANAQLSDIVSRFTTAANAIDPRLADNDTGQITTRVIESAELSLTKTGSTGTVTAGTSQILTYTLTLRNGGPSNARDVRVTDTLPTNVTVVNARVASGGGSGATCTETINDREVVCSLGTVANGATVVMQIGVRALSSAPDSLTNRATVTSPTDDPSGGNNSASVVTAVDRPADMRITKAVQAGTLVAGRSAAYTLTVTNAGPADTVNVVTTDLLPANLTFVSGSSGCTASAGNTTVTCNLGTMTAGAVRTVSFTALIASTAPAGNITNTASVTSGRRDPDTANNASSVTSTVRLESDLQVTKTVGRANPSAVQTEPNVGETFTYTVQVRNLGPSRAYNVSVRDIFTGSLTMIADQPEAGTTYSAGVWTVGTLAVNQTRTLRLVRKAEAPAGGLSIENEARLESQTGTDPNSGNNRQTVTVTPQLADLVLVKDAPATVTAGAQLDYRLAVTNTGPTKALNVVVTDTLPENVFLVNDGVCSTVGRVVTCNTGTLNAGPGIVYTISITRAQAGLITNNAGVTSTTTDPNAANNADSATTTVTSDVPASLTYLTQPGSSATAGVAFSPQPVIELRDRFGNRVNIEPDQRDRIRLTAYTTLGCLGAPTGAVVTNGEVSAAGGVATFLNAFYTRAQTIYLQAEDIDSAGVTPACSNGIAVAPGPAARLAFITPARTVTAGTVSDLLTVERQDAFGNAVVTEPTTVITLTSTSTATLPFLDATGTTPTRTITIAQGTSQASFRYTDTVAGTYTLTADDAPGAGLQAATQQITVSAAPARDLLFIIAPTTPITAGISSDLFTLERRDPFGNPNFDDPDVTVALTSTSTGPYSFRNPADTSTITQVTIPQGSFSTTFRYRDTLAGSYEVFARDEGINAPPLTPASTPIVVVPAPATVLVFTTPPNTITAGTSTPNMTVRRQDAFGNVNTADPNLIVTLSSTSRSEQFVDASTNLTTTQVTIGTGSATASFRYYDTEAGAQTVTATGPGITTPATQIVTVQPAAVARLAYITPPRTVTAGQISQTLTVQRQDRFGNANTVEASLALSLTSVPAGASAFLPEVGTTPIPGVTIAQGSATASFRYTNTLAGSYSIVVDDTIVAGGLPPASQALTVTAAAATRLNILTPPLVVEAGVRTGPIVVERLDPFGNRNSTDAGITVTLTDVPITGEFYAAASGGSSIDSVGIANGVAQATFYYEDKRAGVHTLTTASPPLASDSVTVTVGAGAPYVAKFISPPRTLTAGATSAQITVQLQDEFANIITRTTGSPFAINLNSTSGTGRFRNLANSQDITSVDIGNNQSSAGFLYTDTSAGVHTLQSSNATLPVADTQAINVTAAAEATVRVETAANGSGTVVPGQAISSGVPLTVYAVTRDAFGNFVANRSATWSVINNTPGVTTSNLSSPSGPSTTFTGSLVGTGQIQASYNALPATPSGVLTVTPGPAVALRVETAANGSGGVVPNQTITSGNSIAVYAILRDAAGNFVSNPSAAWSMINTSGGVTNANLSPLPGSSTTFTGGLVGTGQISAALAAPPPSLTTVTPSGVLTVTPGPVVALRVETAANGSGGVVPNQTITSGNSIAVYAILRDAAGNFVSNPIANWSMINTSGGVTNANLSPLSGSSPTFTGGLVGTGQISAALAAPPPSLTTATPSGVLTVVPAVASVSAITGPDTATLNVVTPFTLATRDAFGNPANVGSATAFALTRTLAFTGTFYSDASGTLTITTATVPGGSASVGFFYRPQVAGSHQLRATAAGFADIPKAVGVP